MKLSVMFARFPYGHCDEPDTTDWLVTTVLAAKADPRIGNISRFRADDTPIPMTRNLTIAAAQAAGVDLLCMIDNDMKPDAYLPANVNKLEADPEARPFWESSLDFLLSDACEGPGVIAAPYCGPPPHENIYVFQWKNYQSDHPNPDLHLAQYSREEAALWKGITEVAALPTGLILIDMRALARIPPPYFDYEYADAPYNSRKGSTEDVFFTRNLSLAGVHVYCNWDAWAGHWKRKCVGRPKPLTVDVIRKEMRRAVLNNVQPGERLRLFTEDELRKNGHGEPWPASPWDVHSANSRGVDHDPEDRPGLSGNERRRQESFQAHAEQGSGGETPGAS